MEKYGYQRIKTLGKGSFGSAILCRDPQGHQVVAKEMELRNMSRTEREACINEIKILRTFSHPNIVRYLDHFNTDGYLYIVMEYAESGDLSRYLKERHAEGNTLSEKEALFYFVQVCIALKYCHDKHVLHRDLKSENVLLMGGMAAKLADFGISKSIAHTMALARTQCGSIAYSSPEVAMGKPYGLKSDMWSLGCLLYELCAGKAPFHGGHMHAVMVAIMQAKYPPLPDTFSPELRSIVAALIQEEPADRPTIDEVLRRPIMQEQLKLMATPLPDPASQPYTRFNRAIPRPEDFGPCDSPHAPSPKAQPPAPAAPAPAPVPAANHRGWAPTAQPKPAQMGPAGGKMGRVNQGAGGHRRPSPGVNAWRNDPIRAHRENYGGEAWAHGQKKDAPKSREAGHFHHPPLYGQRPRGRQPAEEPAPTRQQKAPQNEVPPPPAPPLDRADRNEQKQWERDLRQRFMHCQGGQRAEPRQAQPRKSRPTAEPQAPARGPAANANQGHGQQARRGGEKDHGAGQAVGGGGAGGDDYTRMIRLLMAELNTGA